MLKLLTPNEADKVFPDQVVYKTILIIALSTGLPLKDLLRLKWNKLFSYNSKGEAVCLDEFDLQRNYSFPISLKIRSQLTNFYKFLNQPEFDGPIVKSLKVDKNFDTWILATNIALGIRGVAHLDKDEWSKYRNKHLTQILFGRRVFETGGHTNSNCRILKGLFKIQTNDKLFAFLGYDSKSDITYNLSKISIIEGLNQRYTFGEPRSFLDDNKHFFIQMGKTNKYYPFQHFQVFYDFLQGLKINKYDIKTQGVLILLMLSLTNGIRPSTLLKLKWSDIFYATKNKRFDCFVIRREFKFGRHKIAIDENTMTKLLIHFKLLLGEDRLSVSRDSDRLTFLKKTPTLNNYCFVTNRLNPLSQNSLHREIQNTLSVAEFQHADKFTTKSTQIMYGRRIIELKGLHSTTIRALKIHFNIRKTQDLFDFLYISNQKGRNTPDIKEFGTVFEHIFYDV
jgi:hypothetical protein